MLLYLIVCMSSFLCCSLCMEMFVKLNIFAIYIFFLKIKVYLILKVWPEVVRTLAPWFWRKFSRQQQQSGSSSPPRSGPAATSAGRFSTHNNPPWTGTFLRFWPGSQPHCAGLTGSPEAGMERWGPGWSSRERICRRLLRCCPPRQRGHGLRAEEAGRPGGQQPREDLLHPEETAGGDQDRHRVRVRAAGLQPGR